jgi:hypothetical protein
MKQHNLKNKELETNMLLEYKFEKNIKMILANQFITKDIQMDLKKGTDFLIFNIKPFKIGVRLRRYSYYTGIYKNQFTIRWRLPSGVKTEIHKIRHGYVDYILYGFIDQNEKQIIQYFIGDLNMFRKNEPKPIDKPVNKHEWGTQLAVYHLRQFPLSFIKDSNNVPYIDKYDHEKLRQMLCPQCKGHRYVENIGYGNTLIDAKLCPSCVGFGDLDV